MPSITLASICDEVEGSLIRSHKAGIEDGLSAIESRMIAEFGEKPTWWPAMKVKIMIEYNL